MTLSFYVSNETRKIKGNRLVLPPIFAEMAFKREPHPIRFVLFYDKIKGFPCISLYDNFPLFSEISFNDETRAITLTKELKKHLSIDDAITIIGAYDHIELWNPETFREYTKTIPEEYHQQMKKILDA